MVTQPPLKRALSLPLLVLYGLGTTIGAGIYALTGEIAGVAGYLAPLSFLIAAGMVGVTALSFAEISARFPFAAGSALYVKEGFSSRTLSTLVGLLVVLAGLTSSAALVNGFTGYFSQFFTASPELIVILATLTLGLLAAWGIKESVSAAAIITLIEVGGLLLVIGVNLESLSGLSLMWEKVTTSTELQWGGVYFGAILAFYAFIGFEDMVVVAEEVKEAQRNLPRGILLTLAITTLLYVSLLLVAVIAMEPRALAASEAPLAALYSHGTGKEATILSLIGMFAIINGALIQVIMASRLLYGLASQHQLPAILGRVNARTRTPLPATALVTAAVLGLALCGDLGPLAAATSLLMLTVFALVNLALLGVKRRSPRPAGIQVYPRWVPAIGFLLSIGFVIAELAGKF